MEASAAAAVPRAKPAVRPGNPNFSSGPCTKRPGWLPSVLAEATLGRSHRAKGPKARLAEVITRSRALLGMPDDWRLGIVPASDTGAVEMALWSLLGPRPVDILAFESFSQTWASDITKQLRLADARVLTAEYGRLPDLAQVNPAHDLVFAWNGTTSGVRVANADFIAADRAGLAICDATSAAFAMHLAWDRLDVVTWSWQKALGGEAAHGMLALSPRAVARLESHTPAWPMPKLFRLTSGGKLSEGIFRGETINTPSMLCVEDALDGLRWAERIGGLPALVGRSEASLAAVRAWVDASDWAAFLAEDPATLSCTSICLKLVAPWFTALDAAGQAAAAKRIAELLEQEGVAYDIAAYRDAPPGLRIWAGATVEPSDVQALLPWLDWAHARVAGGMTAMPKVLISDKLSPAAVEIFRSRGLEVDVNTGLAPADLRAIIGEYDGLAIRSATKVTRELLEAAPNLKVVGRAGIGVDNVDVKSATARGVVVMNTPYGNAITTAEHAIAMMFALARQIPEASASTKAGRWEKNRFMGVELTGKTLGLVGCGNIGSIVADRAIGLRMRVVAYDPYLTEKRALDLGVEKVELDELLARADIVTLHTPLTEATRNILSREAIAKLRKGARIVNCARGGLVDEAALAEALQSGHIAGAALDVFETEPATDSPLFALENVVCTPHLGAATAEAQENVALQVAEQMSDFLLTGAVANAINMPSVSAEDAPRLKPYMELCRLLGAFAGQLTQARDGVIRGVTIEYEGLAAQMNHRPLTAAALAGLLAPVMAGANMVNAPVLARERGIDVAETVHDRPSEYQTLVRITIATDQLRRAVAGTLFAGARPRIVEIKGIKVEADFGRHMLYVTNQDKPGFIGRFGATLAGAGINIATFHLGRAEAGGDAICLVSVDEKVPEDVLAMVRTLPLVVQAASLEF